MDPPYPKAISLAINIPEKFGKIDLIPFFQRDKVQSTMGFGRTNTLQENACLLTPKIRHKLRKSVTKS
jgi:hypothetical protein